MTETTIPWGPRIAYFELDERLSKNPQPDYGSTKPVSDDFKAFLKMGSAKINTVLTEQLSKLITGSEGGVEDVVAAKVKSNPRAIWTPNAENFFLRVSGSYMEKLRMELLKLDEKAADTVEFAKLKKKEKASEMEKLFGNEGYQSALGLTKKQTSAIASWMPEV